MERPFVKGDRVVIIENCREQFAPNFDGFDTGMKLYEGMVGAVFGNWDKENYTAIKLDNHYNMLIWVETKNLGLILPFVKRMKIDVIYHPEGENNV